MLKYIHCGSDHFDKNEFVPVKNNDIPWFKPKAHTGLWASPADSKNGWYDWVVNNLYDSPGGRYASHFIFTLKPDSKVLYIVDSTTLRIAYRKYNIPKEKYKDEIMFNPNEFKPDFEKIVKDGYDAIHVQIFSGPNDFLEGTYWGMYGWDVDSLLVLNPDKVVEIKED